MIVLLATEQTGAFEKALLNTIPSDAKAETLGISAPPFVYKFM